MRRSRRRIIHEMNVTSLADVSITLLIIFIIAAPLMRTGIDVGLPKSKSVDKVEDEGITVTIDKNGQIAVGDASVSLESLDRVLEGLLARNPGSPVYVRADTATHYGLVIDVMGRAKALGVERIGLLAEESRSWRKK
jgi:biopolymer transport protein ExbD